MAKTAVSGDSPRRRNYGVPDRANNRTKYYITNGGLGTDNQAIRQHDLGSRQGRAAMQRAVNAHAERTGKTSWSYTEMRPYDESSQKIQYKKEID
jgi:hypothetical protein